MEEDCKWTSAQLNLQRHNHAFIDNDWQENHVVQYILNRKVTLHIEVNDIGRMIGTSRPTCLGHY